MNRNKYVFFLVLFFSKLLHTIALRLNLHSMLQFILRTSPWYCVVSHDCIVPCCLCCLIVVMCHHKITHTHMHALACAHTHTHTLPPSISHIYIHTRQHTVYIFRYIHAYKISEHLHRANFRWLFWLYSDILFIGTHSRYRIMKL